MADVISRLRLDSGEFDSKIKRAGQELLAYSEHCKKMGLEMGYANKDAKDFAKALGDMNTVSQTARGKLNELTEAFVNLKAMYNNMTDAEKQNTFGKELAASLDKLKTRIDEAKQNLNSVNAELGNTKQAEQGAKSGLEGLTSALGINLKSLAGWGTALAAGKVALDVAKDAFLSSESNVDEWGRTVAASQSLYESFVASLNTGDFSGFFTNIDNITKAAKEAYDALDELGTRMTIINPERAKLQARQQELRATIRTKGADSTEGKRAAAELKKLQSQLSKTYSSESTMNRNAFEKLVRQRMTEGGINLDERSFREFMKTFDSDANFQQFRNRAKGSIKTIQSSSSGTSSSGAVQTYSRTVDTRNTEKKLMDIFTDEWRKNNSGYLTASYMAQGAAASNALGNARYLREKAGGTGGKPGKTGKTDIQYADDSIMAQEKQVQELTQKWKTASGELRDGYLKQLEDAQQKLAEMTGKKGTLQMETGLSGFNEQTISAWTSMMKSEISKADLGSDLYNSLVQNVSDMNTLTTAVQDAMKLGLKIPQADVQEMFEAIFDRGTLPEDLYAGMIQKFIDEFKERTGKDLQVGEDGSLSGQKPEKQKEKDEDFKKLNDGIGKLTGGLSQIAGGLKAFGIEIPQEVDQVIGVINGISQVISGVGSIISLFSTTALTANTAAIAANTAALATNTATNFIPFFANGGIVHAAGGFSVPGNSFSGDLVPAMLNSGELVLNRAQQGNLASQLEGGAMQNLKIDWVLRSDKLYAVMNNRGRRTGKGELVQRNRI